MTRRLIPWPTLAVAGLAFLGVPEAGAVADAKSQWRCQQGDDGGWVCDAAALPPGPFPATARAPIYKKPPSRRVEEAKRGQVIPQGGQSLAQAELNWVPRRALPTEVAETLEPWCGGAYQPYVWPEDVLAVDPKSAVIGLTADEASYTLGEAAELSGAVQLEQGARRVFAGAAHYDAVDRRLALEEGVSLEEPGLLVRGDSAKVDLESGDAELTGARFVLYDGGYRGSAETFRRTGGKLEIDQARFTRCAPGDQAWVLAAGHIEIPEGENFATARNARLKVRGVPIFWAPYLKVPVSNARQSGWLFPRMGATGSNGVDVSAPYYFNLAPNYDATFIPRYMSERGVLAEGEFRHRSARSENILGAAYMPEDNQYNGQLSFDEFEEQILAAEAPPGIFQTTDRWLLQAKHQGVWLPGLSTAVDFAAVSDRDYFRDLGTDLGVTSKVQLDRYAEVKLQAGNTRMRLWAEDIQLLEEGLPEAYRRLPQLDAAFRSRVFNTPLVFGYDLQYANFDRSDAQALDAEGVTGTRTHIAPRLVLPFERSWGFLRSEVAYQLTSYKLSNRVAGQEETPHRGLPTASVDAGLRFERDLGLGGKRFLQTLEPRLYYLYIEDEDQSALPLFDSTSLTFGHEQLFRENRFASLDRIGDANQVTAALTSRLLSLANGAELLTATVGRIAYFDDQDVTLTPQETPAQDSASGWVSDLVLRLGSGLDARALWVWDSPSSVRDQSMVQLRYRPDGRRVFNLSYRTRGAGIKQADAAFSWPVSSHLALIARYYYDLEESSLIEAFGGFQYDDCCWRLRVVARSFERPFDVINPNDTDRESGVFFDVLMKGLAGFDSGVDSILSNGIRGYEEPINGAVSSKRALALVFGAALLPGFVQAQQQLDRIVAIVNDDVITATELVSRMRFVERQLESSGMATPPRDVIINQVMERLVLDSLQMQMGRRAGVRISEEEITRAITAIAGQNGLEIDGFQALLAQDGMTYREFREQIRQEMIIARVQQNRVNDRIYISPQELENFLESPVGRAATEDEFRVGHILLAVASDATAEAMAEAESKAQSLVAELRAGADFSQAAVANSAGQRALEGGDLGWRKPGQLPSLFAEEVLKGDLGEVLDPIRSASGFHIVKVLDKRGASQQRVQQTLARHILVRPTEIRSDDEAEMIIRDLHERLQGGEDFAQLARDFSDDPGSALSGGDLGWSMPGQMVPAFEAVMDASDPNVVSEPFRSQFGWHILEVLDRREQDMSEEVKRRQAMRILRDRRFDEELEAWLTEIREEAYVELKI